MKTFKEFMEQMTAPLSGDMLKLKQAGVKTAPDLRSVEQKMKSLKSLGNDRDETESDLHPVRQSLHGF